MTRTAIRCTAPTCSARIVATTINVANHDAHEAGWRRTARGWVCRDHAGAGGPHGRDCPDKCSQCLGAAVRRVELQPDGTLAVAAAPTTSGIERDRAARATARARFNSIRMGRRNNTGGSR